MDFLSNDNSCCICRIPGLITTSQNTLLAYYECRKGSASDWAEIDLKIHRSCDHGDSWETVCVISGEGNTLNNPVMIAQDDKIHFLFCKNYKNLFYSVSYDDGRSFSKPLEIPSAFESANFFYNAVAVGPGHGIVFQNRLIIPVWFAYNRENPQAHHPSFLHTLYSEDCGRTWCLGARIPDAEMIDPNESALAITPAGDQVMISIRSESPERMRAFAFSKSGIDNWSNPCFMSALLDPVCQGSMITFDGRIFHINCDSNSKRRNLTVKISSNHFKSFQQLLIDEIGGYSDLAIVENDLCILYERGSLGGKGTLCFQRVPLRELWNLPYYDF